MVHATSADERKLSSSFDSIRRVLQRDEFTDRLDKPLAYWALPNDRRLPLAFLDRSIREILETPFGELMRTRGVGQKKISSLVKLLHRATSAAPPSTPYGIEELAEAPDSSFERSQADVPGDFDPDSISEAVWARWCAVLRQSGLDHMPLGRLAPSLEPLPTVIWETPLSEYMNRTLMEIRQLRTHGEKRVKAVLEIFHAAYGMLRGLPETGHLAMRLIPKIVSKLEAAVLKVTSQDQMLTRLQFVDEFVRPLLTQIHLDCGDMIYELTRQRLGVDVPQKSVREQASDLGVTRARVYQMLEDCAKVEAVRWPEGRHWMLKLKPHLDREASILLRLTMQLFFPGRDDRLEFDEFDEFGEDSVTHSQVAPQLVGD
jgi:hypothetical protein